MNDSNASLRQMGPCEGRFQMTTRRSLSQQASLLIAHLMAVFGGVAVADHWAPRHSHGILVSWVFKHARVMAITP